MLNQATINQLHELKLFGMLDAFEQSIQQNEHQSIGFADGIGLLVDHEMIYRKNKKHKGLLNKAKLRYPKACFEDLKAQTSRQYPKDKLNGLITTQWLENHENVVLSGPTGVGKTYFACAIAQQACRNGYSAKYFRLSKLLEMLRIARSDGTYLQFLARIAKIKCLIIDDWGLEELSDERRVDLLEIFDDRYKINSTIITTQLPIEHWHDFIGEPTIADAIVDRIINNAIMIDIEGDTLRRSD